MVSWATYGPLPLMRVRGTWLCWLVGFVAGVVGMGLKVAVNGDCAEPEQEGDVGPEQGAEPKRVTFPGMRDGERQRHVEPLERHGVSLEVGLVFGWHVRRWLSFGAYSTLDAPPTPPIVVCHSFRGSSVLESSCSAEKRPCANEQNPRAEKIHRSQPTLF